MRLRDFTSIVDFVSDQELEDMQDSIDERRQARMRLLEAAPRGGTEARAGQLALRGCDYTPPFSVETGSVMRRSVLLPAAALLPCASGANCVSYTALGEPAKLSRGNPGPWCFACEKRSGDSKVEAVAARPKVKAAKHWEATKRNRSEGQEPDDRDRAKRFRERPTTERAGAADVGHRPAEEVSRASAIMERRRASMLTCKRLLQSAIVSDDTRLVRTWSKALGDAEARLLWAEADLEASQKRA